MIKSDFFKRSENMLQSLPTKEDLLRLAFYNPVVNHVLAYQRHNPSITTEQALQLMVWELARVNEYQSNMVFDVVKNMMVVNPVVNTDTYDLD